MSPVEIFGMPYARRSRSRLRALARARRAEHDEVQRQLHCADTAPTVLGAADARLLHEPVVVPHDELRFHLLHRVHRHADDDQQRRAAEVELTFMPFVMNRGSTASSRSPMNGIGATLKPVIRNSGRIAMSAR